jgi:hypothetical protein
MGAQFRRDAAAKAFFQLTADYGNWRRLAFEKTG